MGYEFRPAVREKVSLLIALAGPSGSGKTYSAMALAEGLAGPKGKIAFIDTEAGRALHYADRFKFDHCDLRPPFRPQNYTDAIVAAEQAGYSVIVIDSMSHEYEGDGGILDWAASLEKSLKSPGNWKEPKLAHKRMVSRLLQCRAHLIFCLRAEEKIRIEKDGSGKTVVVPAGWVPLCEKRFMFEMTSSFMMKPDYPGIPHPIKLQDQHRAAFPTGKQVGREAGELLAAWAAGGADPTTRRSTGDELFDRGLLAAESGTSALRAWFDGLPRDQKATAKLRLQELKDVAEIADKRDLDLAFDDKASEPSEGADGEPGQQQAA